jgi:hypothetical protein
MDRQKLHAHLGLDTVVSWYGLRGKEYCEEVMEGARNERMEEGVMLVWIQRVRSVIG